MLQHLIAAFVALIVSVSGALAHDAQSVANSIADLVSPTATTVAQLPAPHRSQTLPAQAGAAAAVSATSPIAPINAATSIITAALTATSTDTNSNPPSNNQNRTTQHLSYLSSPQHSASRSAQHSDAAPAASAQNSSASGSASATSVLAGKPGLVLGTATSSLDAVTHAELDAALNALRSQLFSLTSLSGPSAPISVANFAPSQSINQLTNTTITTPTISNPTISTPTISGGSISGASVAGYLPLSGGALTGNLTATGLTLSGNLTVAGAQTLSGAITIPYLTATSTTVASSFQNASSTLFSVFNGAYFGATGTSTFSSSGALTTPALTVLGASSFAISDNFFGLTSFGATGTTTISAAGTITTPSINATNATAASASFGGTATSTFSSSGALALASALTVPNGGTGWAAIQSGAIPYGNGSSALSTTTAGSAGQVLALLNGVPTWTATTTFSSPLSYAAGAVSIAAGNGSTNGYLAATDWSLFDNNKISSSSLSSIFPFTSTTFGATAANSTSTLVGFTSGLYALASSTIGNGTQATGLTISGGATTTGTAYFAGNVGLGTTSPGSLFSLNNIANFTTATSTFYGNGLNLSAGCFSINSTCLSLGSISGTLAVAQGGTGITSYTPGDILYAQTSGSFARIASSSNGFVLTLANGIPAWAATTTLANISGTLGVGQGGTGWSNINAGYIPFGNGTAALSTSTSLFWDSTNSRLGIGTSTPYAKLSVWGTDTSAGTQSFLVANSASTTLFQINDDGSAYHSGSLGIASTSPWARLSVDTSSLGAGVPEFAVGSSTKTDLVITQSGKIGIGTTSPASTFSVSGTGYFTGAVGIGNPGSANSGGRQFGITNTSGIAGLVLNTNGQQWYIDNRGNNDAPNNRLAFSSGATEFMTITTGGNVGIGTTTPSSKLTLNVASAINLNDGLFIQRVSGNQEGLKFGLKSDSTGQYRGAISGVSSAGTETEIMTLGVGDSGAAMGNVGIGTTTPTPGTGSGLVIDGTPGVLQLANTAGHRFELRSEYSGSSNVGFTIYDRTTGTNRISIDNNGNTIIGGPGTTCTIGSGTGATNCTSDQRLKTNIAPISGTDALTGLSKIRGVTFNWADPSRPQNQQVGVIAQDVLKAFPQLVGTATTTFDGVPGSYLTVDYAALVSPLISAVNQLNLNLQTIASTTASSTPESQSFAANFFSSLFAHITAWLSSAENGIHDLYAAVIHATTGNFVTTNASVANADTGNFAKLCVGAGPGDPNPICLTKAQVAALLSQSTAANTPISVSSSGGGDLTNSGNPAHANQNQNGSGNSSSTATASSSSDSSATPPVLQVNGDNPAIIHVGESYQDLGATIVAPAADKNLGLKYFLNGKLISDIVIDTSQVATDTVQYVATDPTGLTATSTRTVIILPAQAGEAAPSAPPPPPAASSTPAAPIVLAASSSPATVASSTTQ